MLFLVESNTLRISFLVLVISASTLDWDSFHSCLSFFSLSRTSLLLTESLNREITREWSLSVAFREMIVFD
jgi:hypothetical protein